MKPRYAQENHTHTGLSGTASELPSGVSRFWTAYGASTLSQLGMAASANGSASTGAITPGDNTLESRPRVRYSSTTGVAGVYATTAFMSTPRGFRARFIFGVGGTLGAGFRAFVGAISAAPALTSNWASASPTGFGVCLDAAADGWKWCEGSGGVTASTVVHASDELFMLDMVVEPGGSTASGRLYNLTAATEESFTWTALPASSTVLTPVIRVNSNSTGTAYVYVVRVETWEDAGAGWLL